MSEKHNTKLSSAPEEELLNWKDYHHGMADKMIPERLREAIGRRNQGMLERAIKEAEAAGYSETDDTQVARDLVKAKTLITLLEAKAGLRSVMRTGSLDDIKLEVDNIKRSKYLMSNMQREVQEAELCILGLGRIQRIKRSVLDMDKRTMSEVRRYHTPPRAVHSILQATLLLLGEDEKITQDWRACQALMMPSGPHSMNKKVMDFDVGSVHSELVARARQILDKYSLNELQPISKGASTFFVWAMAMVEESEAMHGKNPKAADPERQRQILGRPFRNASPTRKRKTYSLVTPRNGTIAKH